MTTRRGDMSPEERRRFYRLMSRIYAVLDSGEWSIAYARILGDVDFCLRIGIGTQNVGTVDDETETIFIDFREDVIATIVHEVIHVIYPDAPEERVKELECFVMENMSPLQAKRIHIRAGMCLK